MKKNKDFDINKVKAEALEVARDKKRLEQLLEAAALKLQSVTPNAGNMIRFMKQIKLSIQMLKASISGEYRDLSATTIVSLIVGVLYFVCPVDFVPDFIPFVGYVDDISILLWIFKNLSSDIELFEKWQTNWARKS